MAMDLNYILSQEDSFCTLDAILPSIAYSKTPKEEYKPIKKNQEWKAYEAEARRLTELQPLHQIKDIEKRGAAFHLDHKISIWAGYKSGIPVEDISHVSNLRIISREENMRKGRRSYYE